MAGPADAPALVRRVLERVDREHRWIGQPELRRLDEARAILNAPDDVRLACLHVLAAATLDDDHPRTHVVWDLLAMTARRRLALAPGDIRSLLLVARDRAATRGDLPSAGAQGPSLAAGLLEALIAQFEAAVETWPGEEAQALGPLIEEVASALWDKPLAARLRRLGTAAGDGLPLDLISPDDEFGRRAQDVLRGSREDEAALRGLLQLLTGLPATGRPSKKWIAAADATRDALHDPAGLAHALIEAILLAADFEIEHSWHGETHTTTHTFHYESRNEDVAVAIAALAGRLDDPALLPKLRALAVKSVTVIGGEYGHPRSLRLANAAAQAIADIGAPASLTELLALERSVRHGTLLKQVRKAIDALAAAEDLTREALLERGVPSHALAPDGTREVALTRGHARVLVDARAATLTYVDPQGRARKTIPAAVRAADGEALAALRAELKEIRKTIAAERHRLDGLLALGRRWDARQWVALYLDHPITGPMTRELVWAFRGPDGAEVHAIPDSATSGTTSDGATAPLPAGGEVRLWHPIDAPAEEVRAWRRLMLDRRRRQPLKQAFRETYALTPAEAQTRERSERFAGHVFRQPQARALMKGRGWAPVALAWWDDGVDHGVARRVFEPHGVRAELSYDPILDIEPRGDLYPYCRFGQVRFSDARTGTPMALADVPRVVFSEAMRDADLVIGVTSIGTDPQWPERPEGRGHAPYWNAYGFGELGEAAKVRREVLAELLPSLAIADRCALEERFLRVRGDLREYRVHLGSGNILMSPNDRYLCVVPARDGRAERLFLPFDDDPVLSLILSKALLLAGDASITDSSILAQIRSA